MTLCLRFGRKSVKLSHDEVWSSDISSIDNGCLDYHPKDCYMCVGGFPTEYDMKVLKCKFPMISKVVLVKIDVFLDACFKVCGLYHVDIIESYYTYLSN